MPILSFKRKELKTVRKIRRWLIRIYKKLDRHQGEKWNYDHIFCCDKTLILQKKGLVNILCLIYILEYHQWACTEEAVRDGKVKPVKRFKVGKKKDTELFGTYQEYLDRDHDTDYEDVSDGDVESD